MSLKCSFSYIKDSDSIKSIYTLYSFLITLLLRYSLASIIREIAIQDLKIVANFAIGTFHASFYIFVIAS